MPGLPTKPFVEPLTQPRHFARPGARERRAQAVHRLQIGLFGLCAMLLIVALANVIMDRARLGQVNDPIQDVVAVDAQPKKAPAADPLADIGVVPAADPSPDAASGVPLQSPSATSSGGNVQPQR